MISMKAKTLQEAIGVILLTGILLATLMVIYGGCSFLINHGHTSFQSLGLEKESQPIGLKQLVRNISAFSSEGIIELGLIILVLTQFIRVACLMIFYLINRDIQFILISSFIFILLIYSFLWRHV